MNWSDSGFKPALFRKYPELGQKLPYIGLGVFPTPIHLLEHLGIENLWIKRDDLSSPVYGGNKIRKLAFILAEARQKKIRHLITLGGIGTNHGLASAIFSHAMGIKCTLLLYQQPVTANVKLVLLMLAKYNARLVYQKSLWRTLASYYIFYRLRYPSAYYLYPGGSSALGTLGYVDAALELKDQIAQGIVPEPGVIFCPLGSGGSLAGLAVGMQLSGMKPRVVGVRVIAAHVGPFQACTAVAVAGQMKNAYAYLKKRCRELPDITLKAPLVINDYFGGGYGMPTQAGSSAYHLMRTNEGILLDPTYTAKTFAAVLDYCRSQRRDRRPVIYWHTYNSVDLSGQAKEVDYRKLPKPLRGFIEQKPVPY